MGSTLRRWIGFVAAGMVALLSADPSPACSMAWTYLKPTNYELVRLADAVVLGRVAMFRSVATRWGERSVVRFQVIDVIKGPFPENRVDLQGDDRFEGGGDPLDFTWARPGAMTGGCQARDYRLDGLFVLLLQKLPKESSQALGVTWSILPYSFARSNEDVASPRAPWAEAVRRYAEIQDPHGSAAERSALLELRRLASAEPETSRFPRGLATDIDRHFATPTNQKSAKQLLDLFRQPEASRKQQEGVLIALANREDPEGLQLIRELISKNFDLGEWRAPIASIAARSSDDLVVSWLFEQYLRSDLNYSSRWSVLGALVAGAGARPPERMLALLRSAGDEQACFMSEWFRKHPSQAAEDELFRRLAKANSEESSLALALAALGDDRMFGPSNPAAAKKWRESWVPNYAIGRSPLPAADAKLTALLAKADIESLVEVAQGLEGSHAPQRDRRLRQIFEHAPAHKSLRCWILRGARVLAYREPDNPALQSLVAEIEAFHQGDQELPTTCD